MTSLAHFMSNCSIYDFKEYTMIVLTDARNPSIRMAAEHLRTPERRITNHDAGYTRLFKQLRRNNPYDSTELPHTIWARHKNIADKLESLLKDKSLQLKHREIVITVPRLDRNQSERTQAALKSLIKRGTFIFWFTAPPWFDTDDSVKAATKGIDGLHVFVNPFYDLEEKETEDKIKEAEDKIKSGCDAKSNPLLDYISYRLSALFMGAEPGETVLGEIVDTLSRTAESRFATPEKLAVNEPFIEAVNAQSKGGAAKENIIECPSDLVRRYVEYGSPSFAGNSDHIESFKERLVKLARVDMNVLIVGETGTGKEAAAYFLHEFSPRRKKPYMVVNCAQFKEELLESYLFGHVAGSFTGADRNKIGLAKLANGGTLFLDELPDASPSVQAKLLRFLATGEFTPLGSTTMEKVNVKVIAGAQPVRLNNMRRDFIERIGQTRLTTLALQELIDHDKRREPTGKEYDVVTIARNLVARLVGRRKVNSTGEAGFVTHKDLVQVWNVLGSVETKRLLISYPWPANVRELKSVLEEWLCLDIDLEDVIRERHREASKLPVDSDVTTAKAAKAPTLPDTESAGEGWVTYNDKDGKAWVSFRPVDTLGDIQPHALEKLQVFYADHVLSSLCSKHSPKQIIGKSRGSNPTGLMAAENALKNRISSITESYPDESEQLKYKFNKRPGKQGP